LNQQKQVLQRVNEELGITTKKKAVRVQQQISSAVMKTVQEFYKLDAISWQAPGKRDTKVVNENGVKVKYQKRHLLLTIREVYELFMEQYPSKKTHCLFVIPLNDFEMK